MERLVKLVEEYLEDYNSLTSKPMKLVMFLDAIEHVSRICRVIRLPLGNALLLGVGGSGRQSLTRLAAFMEEFDVFQIEIAKGYVTTWQLPGRHCVQFLLQAGCMWGRRVCHKLCWGASAAVCEVRKNPARI